MAIKEHTQGNLNVYAIATLQGQNQYSIGLYLEEKFIQFQII